MSGVYTVGGVTPNYVSISAAITALNTNGICGPVTLLLRNGTYNEQITIDSLPGSSPANTLRITSESGDSTQVIWQYSIVNSNFQYTVRFNSACYVTIDHISLKQLSATYSPVVLIENESHHLTFTSLLLQSTASSQNPPNGAMVNSPNTEDNFMIFRNCVFTGASTAIYLLAPSLTGERGIEISGCQFINQSQTGIFLYLHGNVLVRDNTISTSNSAAETGVFIGITDSCDVYNNIIDGAFEEGMLLNGTASFTNHYTSVFNNAINCRTRLGTQYGVYVWNVNKLNLNFNTVRLASNNSYASYIFTSDSCTVRNNIFSVFGTNGVAFYLSSSALTGFTEDNNDFYVSSGLRLYADPNTYTSMSSWRNATGFSTNSLAVDPVYLIPNDCHVHESDLRNSGVAVPGITNDFEQDVRSNPPDIGADEQVNLYLDAEAKRIALPQALCSGVINIPLVLKNQGTITLNQLTINWSLNGVPQPVVNWSGTLGSGDSVLVSLGTFNFLPGPPLQIESVVSNPNLSPDPFAFNDTASYSTGGTALSGVYTVGGAAPNFTTMVQAITALNARGVCGPVTMNIRNGVYVGQLLLNSIAGISSVNRVRFQSQSGDSSQVIISASGSVSANYVASLSAISYITFSKVTFSNTNSTYGNVMQVTGACTADSLYHCVFTTPLSASTAKLIYESGAGNKSGIDISGNRFVNGANAIEWAFSGMDTNIVFNDNAVQCLQTTGLVYFTDIQGLRVERNNIIQGTIYVANIYAYLNISKNRVKGMLHLQSCNSPTNVLIVNNAFTNTNGAILAQFCNGLRIINNTFRCTSNAAAVTFSNSVNTTYLNNLATTTSATGTVLSANHALTFDTCDYNGWYTTAGIFSIFNSTNYNNFAAWQSSTGYDANSIHQDPLYLSATDYHLQNSSPMLQLALSVPEAPDDVDGDTRGATPDFGADENPVYTVEASLTGSNFTNCLNSTTPLTVDILNNGGLSLTSCTINWSINQVLQTPVNWTGSITASQTLLNVPVSTYPFVLGNTYSVKIWVSNPNNSTDPLPYNDTVSGTVLPRYSGVYTVGGSAPDFIHPQSAADSLALYGVCGPVILNIRNGTYEGVDIAPIPGSSAVNTVTLTSESGDSSLVVFQTIPDSLSSTAGATHLLDSTSNITFSKLTFCSGVSVVAQLIQLVNNNNNIVVSHCHFKGLHGTIAPTVSDGLINSTSGIYSNIRIDKNLFVDGATGVALDGVKGLIISDNSFYYQEKAGVRVSASDSLTIRYNQIEDAGVYSDYVGIYCAFGFSPAASDSAIIAENVIEIESGLTGIEYSSGTSSPAFTTLIRNNAISISGSTNTNGIIASGFGVRVIFNTVRVLGSSCNTALAATITNGFIYNNCFTSYCTNGRAFHFISCSGMQQNNNNYYSASAILGSINSTNYATLSAYQSATSSEPSSNSGNPLLFNTPFWKPGSSVLQNVGVSMSSFAPKDIEGQNRMATPDIGVDEYSPIQDLSLYKINSASLTCSGTHTVQVGVRNTGSFTASAFLIHWQVNGISQPTFNWSGSLPAGDSITTVTVGTFTSASGSADVVVHVQFPGDFYAVNDTVRNNRLLGPLSGDYTVGGMNPDFRMLDDAMTAIEVNGVCGPVRILVRDGFYYEHSTLSNPGLTAFNTLTIQSENLDSSAVTIFQFLANPLLVPELLKLDTVSHTTIRAVGFNNGTITPYPSSNAIAGVAMYNCSDIRVTHSMFAAMSPSNASLLCQNAENISLDSNNFLAAYNPVYLGSLFQLPDTVRAVMFYENQLAGNLNVYRATDIMIHDNTMNAFDMQLTGDSISVFRNVMRDHASLNGLAGTPGGRIELWNNFFANGLSAGDIHFTDLQYNNIGFYQPVPNITEALTLTQADYSTVINNNVTCTFYPANGVADIAAPFYITNCTIDYNNYWNGPQGSLISSQQSNGHDVNSISIDPQYISSTDLHVQNMLLAGTAIPIAGIQDDIDGDLRALTSPGIGADDAGAITVYSSLVWPGNANKDTVVNSYDLLPIGVHRNQGGYSRQSFSNSWVGYPCYDWTSNQANGYNMKFADSNGDGMVTVSDTTAVSLNYGQLDFSPPLPPPGNFSNFQSVGPPLHFATSSSVYLAGTAVDVYIWAGDSVQSMTGLYGAAFTMAYTPNGITANSTDLDFLNSWLCNPSVDGLTIERTFESQSMAEGAVVRFDHTGRNGYGPLAVFHFVSDSTITQPTTIYFNFLGSEVVDSAGNPIQVTPLMDSVIIMPIITSVNAVSALSSVTAYPNPANEIVELRFAAIPGTNEVLITDILGQIVYETSIEVNQEGSVLLELDVSQWSSGTYFVTIHNGEIDQTEKLCVSH